MKPAKLITIVRGDLSPGYQIAQTAHAVANYCLAYNTEATRWHVKGNFIISLAAYDYNELRLLMKQLKTNSIEFVGFYEPDIEEYTSIAFVETDVTRIITEGLPLAGELSGTKQKGVE